MPGPGQRRKPPGMENYSEEEIEAFGK